MKKTSRSPHQEDFPAQPGTRLLVSARDAASRSIDIQPIDSNYETASHLRQWMDEGMKGMARDGAVLALGCEEAFLAPQLTQYSNDVTVLDTSAGQIAQLARRFPEVAFLQHKLTNPLPFAHDTFEAIWCCEFLDRVFDPLAALREMLRVLVPGGRLLLTVPNHGAFHLLIGALFKHDDTIGLANPRVRHFTKTTLGVIARDAGWTEIDVITGGGTRKLSGHLLPRSLFLTAKKGRGARLMPVGQDTQEREVEGLWDELAFAGRSMAA